MDPHFLYQRFLRHRRVSPDGMFWDWNAVHMIHMEDFLNDVILKKGAVLVDVGANAGAWALRASPYYEVVYAFEPNPKYFKALQRNIRMNKIPNVIPKNYALYNQSGMTEQSAFDADVPFQGFKKGLVRTRLLDQFKLKGVSLIKIDAEGAGKGIVEGAMATIKDSQPVIIEEVHGDFELQMPELLPGYSWEKRYRDMPKEGWIVKENGKQVFLIGRPKFEAHG